MRQLRRTCARPERVRLASTSPKRRRAKTNTPPPRPTPRRRRQIAILLRSRRLRESPPPIPADWAHHGTFSAPPPARASCPPMEAARKRLGGMDWAGRQGGCHGQAGVNHDTPPARQPMGGCRQGPNIQLRGGCAAPQTAVRFAPGHILAIHPSTGARRRFPRTAGGYRAAFATRWPLYHVHRCRQPRPFYWPGSRQLSLFPNP